MPNAMLAQAFFPTRAPSFYLTTKAAKSACESERGCYAQHREVPGQRRVATGLREMSRISSIAGRCLASSAEVIAKVSSSPVQ